MKTKKTVFLIICAALVLFAIEAAHVNAADSYSEGWNGIGTCEWKIDDQGLLTIRPMGNGSSGTLPNIRSSNESWSSIKKAYIAPGVKAGSSLEGFFHGCSNLSEVNGLSNLDTSDTKDMSGMFSYSGITKVDFSGLNTSKLEAFRFGFEGCDKLKYVNLSGIDTSNLSEATYMFGNSSLEAIDIGSLDLSNADASGMFYGTKIKSIDFSKVKTAENTNFYGAFGHCEELEEADLRGINGSNYACMLQLCPMLKDVDLTGAVFNNQNQWHMFYGCNNLSTIPTGFRFTGNVSSFSEDGSVFYASGNAVTTKYKGCDAAVLDYDWISDNRILDATVIDHKYSDWTITKEPTCTQAGTKTKTCSNCEDAVEEEIPALGHEWNNKPTVDRLATCKAEGSESIHCSKCRAIKEDSTRLIPKNGHCYGEWEITEPATELNPGTRTRSCTVCGHSETETIAQLAPTLKAVKILKPVAGTKSANIKWKAVSKKSLKKTKKIQIQYSLDKQFRKGVKTKYASAKKTALAIKGLKSKKKYYVRIRAYTKSGGKVHISKWSAVKSVKIK